MRKCALLCLLMAWAMPGHAFDLTISDNNFRRCIEQHVEQHGWQSPAEITELKCHSQGIRTLQGIQALNELVRLSLYNNEITAADLRGLNRLRSLNLAKNQLQHVELSHLPELQEVYLFNNLLLTMVLDTLPRLTQLRGNNNQLETFDYRDLPKLEKIYLFNNQLETIDIDNLPSLSYMDVRQNPMPDELYERMDAMENRTFLHDGNAEDWQ